jgi:hypothetical protein
MESDVTDSLTAYASGGNDNLIALVTVPAAAYNALTNIVANDFVGIAIQRDASHANDTYEDIWQVVGVLFKFA